MSRTLMNIFLIVIICFTLTAFPINRNLLSFDFSRFLVQENINQQSDINGVSFTYTLSEKEASLFNPSELTFTIQAESSDRLFTWKDQPKLILELTDRMDMSKKFNHDSFVTLVEADSIENPTQYTYTLDLSKTRLALENGSYNVSIHSDNALLANLDPLVFKATYIEDIHYAAGIREADAQEPYLILYFTDPTKRHLVPVSRPTVDTNKVFRKTVNGLLDPPEASLGLSQDAIAPKISIIQYSSGLVTCFLKSSDVIPFSEDPVSSKLALDALTNTIMHIQTPYAINKVQYLVDKQPSQIYFSGTDLSEPILKDKRPLVYLGLKTHSDRILITPLAVADEALDTLISRMIESMKKAIVEGYEPAGLLPVLPDSLELLDYKLEGVTLKLDFNADIRDVYQDAPGLSQLMIDSLSASFASIDGVDNIEIQMNGKTITSIGDLNFETPIEPPLFMNVEKAE